MLGDSSIELEYLPTNDIRSYHVNSEKVKKVLGFEAKYTIEDAVQSLAEAYKNSLIQDPLNNPLYYNIKLMQKINLS